MGKGRHELKAEVGLADIGCLVGYLGAVFAPLCILGWQAFTWLKFGYWPPVSVVALYDKPPHLEWVGLQRLLEGTPLSLFLFLAFLGLGLGCLSMAERGRKKLRDLP